MRTFGEYRTIVFDCDGVILDSNGIKSEAFRSAALPHGTAAAERLVAYNRQHGGVSRFEKFKWFVDEILNARGDAAIYDTLLGRFSQAVTEQLMTAPVAPGLTELRRRHPGQRWLIASGGAENELREVFARRDIGVLFDGGIFGSPKSKGAIVRDLQTEGALIDPTLFIGDSRLDHQVALEQGLDFLFVSGWTELEDWQGFVSRHSLDVIVSVDDLLKQNDSLATPGSSPAGQPS